jgi:hypothetical protein
MKLFEDDSNDKTLKPTFHIVKDSSKFGFFCFSFWNLINNLENIYIVSCNWFTKSTIRLLTRSISILFLV